MTKIRTKLTRYKVTNFRTIKESDWIEISSSSCLIGTNEAGKTNLLMALWKLNPASDGEINPITDFPRDLYNEYKPKGHSEDIFISADFRLSDEFVAELSENLGCDSEQVQTVLVERKYSGEYEVKFPYSRISCFPTFRVSETVDHCKELMTSDNVFLKIEKELENEISNFFMSLYACLEMESSVNKENFEKIFLMTQTFIHEGFGKKKNIPKFFEKQLLRPFEKYRDAFDGEPIRIDSDVRETVLDQIPKFIYYSDYGNLDSEIFLPRVKEDLSRDEISQSTQSKLRTLKVLFKYVNLSPEEIFELGNDNPTVTITKDQRGQVLSTTKKDLSEEEILEWGEKKKERSILLNSAAVKLTKRFRDWWKQGEYTFLFTVDGNHFRIDVSDRIRPEPIELDARSRGLQWFFSFFLVFLVEREGGHSDSILLLDEPGLSLHPLAQSDLAHFFRSLSRDNQLIYTSHSPFLVDMDNLANVKAVYVDKDTGRTKITSDLRSVAGDDADRSIYPVHAALGLTVSETLLLGCTAVLVEGVSDQIYFNVIKRYLIGSGRFKHTKEFVFISTGGTRGVKPISKLVSSRDNLPPMVILDSDSNGRTFEKNLKAGYYELTPQRVVGVGEYITDVESPEIEDLIPSKIFTKLVDRKFRYNNRLFEEVYKSGSPIVDQIVEWAEAEKIELETGWKVELARDLLNGFERYLENVDEKFADIWESIFSRFSQDE